MNKGDDELRKSMDELRRSINVQSIARPVHGKLITVTAPSMFAGKTEAAHGIANVYAAARRVVWKCTYFSDLRFGADENTVITNGGQRYYNVHHVRDPAEILKKIPAEADVILIDEVQFFDISIVEAVETLLEKELIVILCGLYKDFRDQEWGHLRKCELLGLDKPITLNAVCMICLNQNAVHSRRLEPLDNGTVDVGGPEKYYACCRSCDGSLRGVGQPIKN